MDALSKIDGANGKVPVTDLEAAVLQRYGDAAPKVEQCLCLPVSYDKGLLGVIPQEIIGKDNGCGDPSRYVRRRRHLRETKGEDFKVTRISGVCVAGSNCCS